MRVTDPEIIKRLTDVEHELQSLAGVLDAGAGLAGTPSERRQLEGLMTLCRKCSADISAFRVAASR